MQKSGSRVQLHWKAIAALAAVFLSGLVAAQALTVSPNPIAFGNRVTGTAFSIDVLVSNPSAGAVNLRGLSVSGGLSFMRTGGTCPANYPATLAPSSSCTVAIQLLQSAPPGTPNASLNIFTDSGSLAAPITATLSTDSAPLTPSAAAVGFGLGATGILLSEQSRSVTFTNTSATTVYLTRASGAPIAFGLGANTSQTASYVSKGGSCVNVLVGRNSSLIYELIPSLAPGESCDFVVQPAMYFKTAGTYDSTMTLLTSAGATTVELKASVGTSGNAIGFDQSELAFGSIAARTTATRTLTLSAPVSGATSLFAIELSGGTGFSRAGGTCPTSFPATLSAGTSCTVTIQLVASAFSGPATATLNFTADTGNSATPISASVIASGVPPIASVTTVDFGWSGIGTNFGVFPSQSVTFTNTSANIVELGRLDGSPFVVSPGIRPLTVGYYSASGSCINSQNTSASASLVPSLGPGESCTLTIGPVFLGWSARTYDTVMTLVTSAGNTTVCLKARIGAPPLPISTAADCDNDGIPDAVEVTEGRNPTVKDNQLFAGLHTNSDRWFVMQQYRDFLSREAETTGLNDWTSRLNSNAMSREAVIQGFFSSPEFQSGVPSVVRLYLGFFNRIPDSEGLKGWVASLRGGTPVASIATAFARSEEFSLTYGALTNEQFVTLVYRNVLGRTPDTVGYNGWLAQINNGASRGSVMVGFTESPEFQMQSAPNVFVIMMYEGMLRRAADATGYKHWVDYINRGQDALEITRGFLFSQEYRNRFLP